jgi:DNA ligase-1
MSLVRPLLAAKTTDADLQRLFGRGKYYLASPKLDGVRALVYNGQLVSRTMKLIPNAYTQNKFGRPEYEGLDGELCVGLPWAKDLMQVTMSGVMSRAGIPNVTYNVFDRWDLPESFMRRRLSAVSFCKPELGIVEVPHVEVYTYTELMELEQQYLEAGYEGVMLREVHGRYKQNRSTLNEGILLKVKRFHDSEATILDASPLMRNLNSRYLDQRGLSARSSHREGKVEEALLGSLLVKDVESGVVFEVGSGFTEAQRQELWGRRSGLMGLVIKYKSFTTVGVKDKPRFPIFIGFRSHLDM